MITKLISLMVFGLFFAIAALPVVGQTPKIINIQKPVGNAANGSPATFGSSPGLSGFIVNYTVSDKGSVAIQSGNYNIYESFNLTITGSGVGYNNITIGSASPKNAGPIVNLGTTPITLDPKGGFPDYQGSSVGGDASIFGAYVVQKGGHILPGTNVTIDFIATGHTYSCVPTNNSSVSYPLTGTFGIHIRWVVRMTSSGAWAAVSGPTLVQ